MIDGRSNLHRKTRFLIKGFAILVMSGRGLVAAFVDVFSHFTHLSRLAFLLPFFSRGSMMVMFLCQKWEYLHKCLAMFMLLHGLFCRGVGDYMYYWRRQVGGKTNETWRRIFLGGG